MYLDDAGSALAANLDWIGIIVKSDDRKGTKNAKEKS